MAGRRTHPIYICWYHMTSGRTVQNTDAVDWMQVYQHLPLFTMDEAARREIPAWREAVTHDIAGEYWSTIRYQDKFKQVDGHTLASPAGTTTSRSRRR